MYKKILVFFLTFLDLALVLFFSFALYIRENGYIVGELIDYSQEIDLNYDVILKENNLIPESYDEDSRSYILNLVDSLKLNPTFKWQTPKKTSLEGQLQVIVNFEVFSKELSSNTEHKLLSKNEVVLEDSISLDEQSELFKDGEVSIPITSYIQELENFKKQLSSRVSGVLKIFYKVDYEGTVGIKNYNDTLSVQLTVPLNETFEITKNVVAQNNRNLYDKKYFSISDWFLYLLAFLILILFGVICFLIKQLMNERITPYQKLMQKIYANYEELIVEVKNKVQRDDYVVTYIGKFNEFFALSRELDLPMMHYKDEDHDEFYIIEANNLYMYNIFEKNVNRRGIKKYF